MWFAKQRDIFVSCPSYFLAILLLLILVVALASVLRSYTTRNRRKVGSVQGGEGILSLTGEVSVDLGLWERGDVPCVHADTGMIFILSSFCSTTDLNSFPLTVTVRCYFSKMATTQKCPNLGLLIADEVQMVVESWPDLWGCHFTNTIHWAQIGNKTRMSHVVSLTNAGGPWKWMGSSEHTIFNFLPRFVNSIPRLWFLYLLYLNSSVLDHPT